MLPGSLECRLAGCGTGCLAGPSAAASAVVRVAVGCGARVAACGDGSVGSWGPHRGPDADRKGAWACGGSGSGIERTGWPRPARLQRTAVGSGGGGGVLMTASEAGGPGSSGSASGGGISIAGRVMDLDLSQLTLAEREAIMHVLKRDEALRKMEERRIL